MKPFISTGVYGIFNFIIALTLIASPWIFGLVNVSSAALFLPIYLGWLQLILAIFSNHEAGFFKQLPVQTHMVIDVFMGFILIISPFLWNFSSKIWWPEVLLGGLLLCAGIFTSKSPFLAGTHKALPEGQLTSTDSLEGRLNNY